MNCNIIRFEPPPLKIELMLDAGSNYPYFSGTYLQGTGLINENPFWLQQNGCHAIWHQDWYVSDWMIGDETNLGERLLGKIIINPYNNTTYPNFNHSVTLKDIEGKCVF